MSIIYYRTAELDKTKPLALFDLDDTLIKTKNNKKYDLEWQWFNNNVKQVLTNISQGANIVIISNQAGISHGYIKKDDFMLKIVNIFDDLKLNINFFASIEDDKYRKPRLGIIEDYLSGYEIIAYVGDAAGRKRDHNDTDLKYAKNIGCDFFVPEQIFIDDSLQFDMSISYPTFVKSELQIPKFNVEKDLIIMYGFPGSGKSTIAKRIGLPIASNDIDGKRCNNKVITLLSQGSSVIVDNTNLTKINREFYIRLAKNYGYNIYCVMLNTSLDICKHNMLYRDRVIPSVALNTMMKKNEIPTKNEGFNEIYDIQYAADTDDDKYFKYMF